MPAHRLMLGQRDAPGPDTHDARRTHHASHHQRNRDIQHYAGALGLRLAGPRVYGETLVADGWMGDGRAEATAADLRRALRLYRVACGVQVGVIALGAAAFSYCR